MKEVNKKKKKILDPSVLIDASRGGILFFQWTGQKNLRKG